jgi:3-dehydroquinate dehydratase type I
VEDLQRLDEFVDAGVEALEFRLDRLAALDGLPGALGTLPEGGLVTVGTFRSQAEGGEGSSSEQERIAVLTEYASLFDAIDVEMSSTRTIESLREGARSESCALILSFHDFARPANAGQIEELWARALELGADFVKIATISAGFADTNEYFKFALQCEDPERFIGIPMGAGGTYGRFTLPLLASPIAYGAVAPFFAPGQPPVPDLIDFYRRVAPSYNEAMVKRLSLLEGA